MRTWQFPYATPICSPMDWYGCHGVDYGQMFPFGDMSQWYGSGFNGGMLGSNSWPVPPMPYGFAPGTWQQEYFTQDYTFGTMGETSENWNTSWFSGEHKPSSATQSGLIMRGSQAIGNNADLCRAPEASGMTLSDRVFSHIQKGDLQRRQWESYASRFLDGNRDPSLKDDASLLPFVNQYVA